MDEVKYCKCGCGKEITIKTHHKYYGIPNYLIGHNPSWIKGKKGHWKHTEEWKKKARQRMLGSKNPFYGKCHTEETKKKIKLFKKGHVPYMKGRHHTKEAKLKNRIKHLKYPYLQNKLSAAYQSIRHSIEYKRWRQECFNRDDYTCQKCKKRGLIIEAHHKKAFAKLIEEMHRAMPLFDLFDSAMIYVPLWDVDNGITLCQKCHNKISFKQRRKNATKRI